MRNEGKNRFYAFSKKLTQSSFTHFFDFYYSRLFLFSKTITKSELIAEEVVMDVFMKLWEKRNTLDRIKNIETYLYISVRNKAINALKKEKKFSFEMIEGSNIQIAKYKHSAENAMIEDEMFESLNQAVAKLPGKCKIIFKLIREDGLNRHEVAQILNISVKTVDNQITIAVQKIAEHLNIDLTSSIKSKRFVNYLLSI